MLRLFRFFALVLRLMPQPPDFSMLLRCHGTLGVLVGISDWGNSWVGYPSLLLLALQQSPLAAPDLPQLVKDQGPAQAIWTYVVSGLSLCLIGIAGVFWAFVRTVFRQDREAAMKLAAQLAELIKAYDDNAKATQSLERRFEAFERAVGDRISAVDRSTGDLRDEINSLRMELARAGIGK